MGNLRPQTGQCAMHSCMAVSFTRFKNLPVPTPIGVGRLCRLAYRRKGNRRVRRLPAQSAREGRLLRTQKNRAKRRRCAPLPVGRQSDASGFTEAKVVYDKSCAVCKVIARRCSEPCAHGPSSSRQCASWRKPIPWASGKREGSWLWLASDRSCAGKRSTLIRVASK